MKRGGRGKRSSTVGRNIAGCTHPFHTVLKGSGILYLMFADSIFYIILFLRMNNIYGHM
jgi:hypothetical protein